MQRAGADQDGHLLAGVQNLGRAAKVHLLGHDVGPLIAWAGAGVAVGAGRRLVGAVGQVVGHDGDGHTVAGLGEAHAAVDDHRHLLGLGRLLHVLRHIGEHAVQVDLLLVVGAAHRAPCPAGDGEHRLVIRLGVIEPGDHVGRAGTAGGQAHAGLSGELGVGRGHERRHLLVANLDEVELVAGFLQTLQHAVDAVAGVTEDRVDPPSFQALDEEFTDGLLGHGAAPVRGRRGAEGRAARGKIVERTATLPRCSDGPASKAAAHHRSWAAQPIIIPPPCARTATP